MTGWTNIDKEPSFSPDLVATIPPIPFPNEWADEIYMGHFLEHLNKEDGRTALSEAMRVLKKNGKIGIVVPDLERIFKLHFEGKSIPITGWDKEYDVTNMDDICELWLYGEHLWSYTPASLRAAMAEAGFVKITEINRLKDPRLVAGVWWQCGFDGVKP